MSIRIDSRTYVIDAPEGTYTLALRDELAGLGPVTSIMHQPGAIYITFGPNDIPDDRIMYRINQIWEKHQPKRVRKAEWVVETDYDGYGEFSIVCNDTSAYLTISSEESDLEIVIELVDGRLVMKRLRMR